MTHTMVRQGGASVPAPADGVAAALPGPQKAAIIIQMILSEGGSLPLSSLSARGQARLMQDFVEIGRVDRATLNVVVADLERDLSMVGLSFPRSVADALGTLEAHLNPDVVTNLRNQLGLGAPPAPWGRIVSLSIDQLVAIVPNEDPKIAAILLSKLDPEKASELLETLPPEQATQVALAMQDTATVSPELVTRIGTMLAAALPSERPKAFADAPALRVANLLNAASPDKRDSVLDDLTKEDPDFAALVRGLIFTFADIATRIAPPDVAKITRDVPQEDLVAALAYAITVEAEATEFLLANMSQRMAGALREEMEELGDVPKKAGEAAMGLVTSAIRKLSDAGEVTILAAKSDDAPAQ